jgi:hypothetical protein
MTLPRLLRSALSCREGRPTIDNLALEAAADWLEVAGRGDDAAAVRLALGPDPSLDWDGDWRRDAPSLATRCDLGRHHYVCVEVQADPRPGAPLGGFASAYCFGARIDYPLTLGELAGPSYAFVRRVRDLARWHCLCDMLGWPPLRLVGMGEVFRIDPRSMTSRPRLRCY